MNKMTWNGIVGTSQDAWGFFSTVTLEDEQGFKIDLVARINEAVLNYGSKVSVRYWTAKERQPKEQLVEGTIRAITGSLNVDHDAQEYQYSEYTSGCDYFTIVNVDRHDLYSELCSHREEFLWLEMEFSRA